MQLQTGHLAGIALALLLAGCGGGGGSKVAGTAIATAPPPPPAVQQSFVFRDKVSASPDEICPLTTSLPAMPVGLRCPGIDTRTIATVDGRPFDLARLAGRSQGGKIAIVWGTMNVGTLRARAIEFDIQHAAVGDIEATEPARGQLWVLGQRIQVVETTWLDDGVAIDDLVVGRRVSVSGYFSSSGIVATAIHDDPGTAYVVRGFLQSDGADGFRIGALRLDLTRSGFIGFPSPDGMPSDGDVVLAFADAAPVQSVLAPQTVLPVRDYVGPGTEDFRFYAGLVSRRPSQAELEIEGSPIDCAAFGCQDLAHADVGRLVSLTHYEDDNTANVLAIGGASYEITGRVSAIDATLGLLTVLGFPAQVMPTTLFVDAQEQSQHLSDIEIGETVTVNAGLVGTAVIASKIGTFGTGQSIVSNFVSAFEGSSTAIDDDEVRILGRTFIVSASTPVFESCTGARSPEWLLEVYQQERINSIRIEVSNESAGPIAPVRIEVTTKACARGDY
ncbi:MAG TPA: DUF5666 domain-containing protein [Pseudomonadales bacterium]